MRTCGGYSCARSARVLSPIAPARSSRSSSVYLQVAAGIADRVPHPDTQHRSPAPRRAPALQRSTGTRESRAAGATPVARAVASATSAPKSSFITRPPATRARAGTRSDCRDACRVTRSTHVSPCARETQDHASRSLIWMVRVSRCSGSILRGPPCAAFC